MTRAIGAAVALIALAAAPAFASGAKPHVAAVHDPLAIAAHLRILTANAWDVAPAERSAVQNEVDAEESQLDEGDQNNVDQGAQNDQQDPAGNADQGSAGQSGDQGDVQKGDQNEQAGQHHDGAANDNQSQSGDGQSGDGQSGDGQSGDSHSGDGQN